MRYQKAKEPELIYAANHLADMAPVAAAVPNDAMDDNEDADADAVAETDAVGEQSLRACVK